MKTSLMATTLTSFGKDPRSQCTRRISNDDRPNSTNATVRQCSDSFRQPVTNSISRQEGTSATSSSENQNTASNQTPANFHANLFSARGKNAENLDNMLPVMDDQGLTKDYLASSIESTKSSDSNRYDRNLALLNNFDTADTNSDGTINHNEAHSFNELNNIPTIENGIMAPTSQPLDSQTYRPAFGAQMTKNLQGLIHHLASTNATSGGDHNADSLKNFIESFKSNLNSLQPTGNVVNTMA
ncbi:hypothetical protein CCP3SC5AM1_2570001 [Gammaproteobacteria bacterium]